MISTRELAIGPEAATATTADRAHEPAPPIAGRAGLTSIDGGGCVVWAARSVEVLETLRADWTSLLGDSLHTDPDYFLWSLRAEPHVVAPHVVVIERDGRVEGMVVARIVDARLPCKVGRHTVYAPTVRAICVMHDGWLGREDAYTAEVILDELVAVLDRGEADVLLFRQLEQDSVLHRAALARSTFASRRQHVARTDVRWLVELRPTQDEYLASVSSSTRKAVRRTASRLDKQFGERLSVKAFRSGSDVDVFLDDAESVAARTYQRRLGVGYLGSDRQRARLRLLAERGWFRGYVMYLDGRPIAFELGELYRGRFQSIAGAYDPAYAQQRVGAYLLVHAIADLGANADAALFDFGFGDAEYKSKLAHRSVDEGDLVIYARRLRPIWINLVRTALLEVSRAVTTGLGRLGLLERMKRWARIRGDGAESAGSTG